MVIPRITFGLALLLTSCVSYKEKTLAVGIIGALCVSLLFSLIATPGRVSPAGS